jgi:diguanylate cyclase (GGDEF)-like protein
MDNGVKHPSRFAEELEMAIAEWAPYLPAHVRAAFRTDFERLGQLHDVALKTIEGIWARHERAYAFDESTGLATRRTFRDHLASTLTQAQHDQGIAAIGVLFIDVNNLKAINDSCGHQVGDRALAAVGGIVREALRVEQGDIVARANEDDYAVARHGGDEFVVALRLSHLEGIAHVAPRIKRRADDRTLQKAHGYTADVDLTVAVGGVAYEAPAVPPTAAPNAIAAALLAAADALMYRSKKDGGVHVALARFTDKLEVHADRCLRVPAAPPVFPTVATGAR